MCRERTPAWDWRHRCESHRVGLSGAPALHEVWQNITHNYPLGSLPARTCVGICSSLTTAQSHLEG